MEDTRAHTSDNTYSHSHVLYSSINMSMLTCRNDLTSVCAVHYTVGVPTSTVLLYCSITPCTVHLLSHACMLHNTGMIKQYSLAIPLLPCLFPLPPSTSSCPGYVPGLTTNQPLKQTRRRSYGMMPCTRSLSTELSL